MDYVKRDTIANAPPERLREALECAIQIIINYRMDIRDPDWVTAIRTDPALADKKSLAEIGFCQGELYTDALDWISGILEGTRRFR